MLNSQKKANIIFFQISLIFFAFFLLLAYVIIIIYGRLLLIWPAIIGKLEAACGCTNHFAFSKHPFLFISIIFFGLAVSSFFYFSIKKIIKITRSTKKFVNNNLKHKKNNFSEKLNKIALTLNMRDKITEIDSSDLTVFCYGLKPKICISRKFSEKLDEAELTTVLLHEQCHLKNNEPLRIFLIKAIQRILFFAPGIKSLSRRYIVFSELAADEWALKITNNKTSLASAFYKILKFNAAVAQQSSLALPFFNTIIDARINKISGDKLSYKLKLLNPKFLLIVFFLASSAITFNIFIFSGKSAIANYFGDGSCALEQTSLNGQCQMTNDAAQCDMNAGQPQNSLSCEVPLEN